MAIGARERGMAVIAVTSVAQSMSGEPGHVSGTRLLDHADVVIDLCTPIGDAMVVLEGVDTPVGPGSTVAYAAIVNEIKVQTAALLLEKGALPPVITAPALVGRERADSLFDGAYEQHSQRLGRLFTG
jgi:uncharacterized phosphosugar-binding protein